MIEGVCGMVLSAKTMGLRDCFAYKPMVRGHLSWYLIVWPMGVTLVMSWGHEGDYHDHERRCSTSWAYEGDS